MSKVLREKVGCGPDRDPTTCSWVRFDPSAWVTEVVGYDLSQVLGSQMVVGYDLAQVLGSQRVVGYDLTQVLGSQKVENFSPAALYNAF